MSNYQFMSDFSCGTMVRLIFKTVISTFFVATLLFVVSGTEVDISEAPFTVYILLDDYSPACVGVIINERSVLTSAHCGFYPGYRYSVRAGSNSPYEGGQLIKVSYFNKHPNFTRVNEGYDVAVLQLASRLSFGKNVANIALANLTDEIPEDSTVRVYGWGKLIPRAWNETLQFTDFPLVDNDQCKLSLEFVDNNMYCGKLEETEDKKCISDSGAPLTYQGVHYGITSVGYGCQGNDEQPTVFTKTGKFRAFIDDWA